MIEIVKASFQSERRENNNRASRKKRSRGRVSMEELVLYNSFFIFILNFICKKYIEYKIVVIFQIVDHRMPVGGLVELQGYARQELGYIESQFPVFKTGCFDSRTFSRFIGAILSSM